MKKITRDRVIALLESIRADFPRRKLAAEKLMKQLGLTESLDLEIAAPDRVVDVPTFDPKVSRELTPMLKARFDYAGSFKRGRDIWLSASEMASCMNQRGTREYHRSLRDDWEGSAPMIFSDDHLALFGITSGVPENLTYLVWATDGEEPEVWVYAGMESHKFKNLVEYLTWCLQRE